MRKIKVICRRGFAMLLAFTMCMGLMQNAAFASTGENSVVEEVVEAENMESSSEETIGEDIQEDSDLQGGTEEEGNSVSVEIINMGEETKLSGFVKRGKKNHRPR